MESQESENTSLIPPEVRREVYQDLKTKLINIMDRMPGISGRQIFNEGKDTEQIQKTVNTKTATYAFMRNVNPNDTELTINKSGKLVEDRDVVLEAIRFKFGTHSLKPVDPLFEYHKTMKEGGSLTLQNTIGSLRMIEQFIKDFQMEAKR